MIKVWKKLVIGALEDASEGQGIDCGAGSQRL